MSSDASPGIYDNVGLEIKSDHIHSYRRGQWGRVAGVRPVWVEQGNGLGYHRLCYVIAWSDQIEDVWPVEDDGNTYVFREPRD